ncbi:Na+/H+ antiporter subunit E [Brevibacterium yomogidense]|uniref:Na+/H+ antiporter subunit E n=1 Tax=Brevibacterium yomogidense TaxID=946573 RepID=UPI0018E05CA6|nr:Na+/H+ antiporter subunit E [Brevibacterium yomogidense]
MVNPLRLIGYFLWIGKEIVSGTIDTIGGLVNARGYSRPMIVQLPLRCTTDLEITMFASSITITPGTLVVAVAASDGAAEPPSLFVHALFADSEEDAMDGLYDMETRLLTAMRGRAPRPVAEVQKTAQAGTDGPGAPGTDPDTRDQTTDDQTTDDQTTDDLNTDDQRGGSA